MAHSGQTQVSGTLATGSSSRLAESSGGGVMFSVGEGGTDRNNLGASNSSSHSVASASAMSAHSGGQPVASSRVRSYQHLVSICMALLVIKMCSRYQSQN